MSAQLKQLIQKRNKLSMDLRIIPKQWQETNRQITRLTELSMLATWHRHFDGISISKDAKKTLSAVSSLSVKESRKTGLWLLYRSRVYASDRAKASAFIQVDAENSVGKEIKKRAKHSWIFDTLHDPDAPHRGSR